MIPFYSEVGKIEETTMQFEAQAGVVPIPIEGQRRERVTESGVEPVSFGVPLPLSLIHSAETGELVDRDGTRIPVQLTVLSNWHDGSVKWLLADAILPGNYSSGDWMLEIPRGEGSHQTAYALSIAETDREIVVQTGAEEFRIDRSRLRPFKRVCQDGNDLLEVDSSGVFLTDRKGRRWEAECDGWRVDVAGPIRSTLVGEGRFRRVRGLRVRLRLSFFAETGLVKLETSLHNPHRAKHPGGIWDLGDAGSVLFQELSLGFSIPEQHDGLISYSPGGDFNECVNSVTIYQDSSGGENWNSKNHVNRDGRVPCRFRGYQLIADESESFGLQAKPTVAVSNTSGVIALAVPEFWQQFPKSISARKNAIEVGLFPREFDDLHELQGGERKTHTVWLQFGAAESDATELSWVHASLVIRSKPEWYDDTDTLPTMALPKTDSLAKLESLLRESLEGQNSLLGNRERVDEYGWRNYGDIFADHEQVYYTGAEPLISHYNNQFDMVFGFLVHYLRTGDRRWWELGDALARHVMDIDIYHTKNDKTAYNGGLFWFTDHYLHAHTSTHRTYSESNRTGNEDYGGGPGAKHNFTTGLLLHYWLTGNPDSRDAVRSLADWVIAMDDGRRTIFGILDDGYTGLASGSNDYQGPDRAGGNSINALLDAWVLTQTDTYLNYAELLIRRCVHPEQDVAALSLLDVENRWSYTVFLSSLAKYLELKLETGQTDEMAAYAQCSLLRYAEWMLENEKPYFDQVEKLEFPTEAWAAQEFRKANVFRLAAEHAEEPLRGQLVERGHEFAHRAWRDLNRFDTRTYARAIAIVMVEGLRDCSFQSIGPRHFPRLSFRGEHGKIRTFMPQRRRIRESFRRPDKIARMTLSVFNPARWLRYFQLRRSYSRTTIGGGSE